MADSEDEYERRGRGRDKFKRERADYPEPQPARSSFPLESRNEPFNNSGWTASHRNFNSSNRGYNDRMSGPRHRRDYRDDSPPNKRRRDYDANRMFDSQPMSYRERPPREDIYSQPLMSMRQFLLEASDDSVNDDNLITKYNQYKLEHRRRSVLEFFNKHKDEEWFRSKYLPDELAKAKEIKKKNVNDRLRVFKELDAMNLFKGPILDIDKSEEICRILDTAVIKLEGGNENDLLALDEKEVRPRIPSDSVFAVVETTTKPDTPTEKSSSNGEVKEEESNGETKNESNTEKNGEANNTSDDVNDSNNLENNNTKEEKSKPRALHKTCSIFFRNILPHITKQEIEDECKKIPGFLRLSLSEPIQMDKRFIRRGWATFDNTVDIKQISWTLSDVKFRGTDIGPIVNRTLSMRTRSVNGIASHKTIVQQDIRLAARLIKKLDKEMGLWVEFDSSNETDPLKAMAPSKNPLLMSITDHLVEVAPAEEEELLGIQIEFDPITGEEIPHKPEGEIDDSGDNGVPSPPKGVTVERCDDLLAILDKLLFYLRIVHSFDYYKNDFYLDEDSKPNRIGVIHARGLVASGLMPPKEIVDWRDSSKAKIEAQIAEETVLPIEEAQELGYKTEEEATEQFLHDNTKEVGEGKYLCPLSNKKFMAPEFVHKHILNKHTEALEQAKAEQLYLNNYILDPKRPPQPEPTSNSQQTTSSTPTPQQLQQPLIGNYGIPTRNRLAGRVGPPNDIPDRGAFNRPFGGGRPFRTRYRDLDAPAME